MLGNVSAACGAIDQLLTRELSPEECKALLTVAEEHLVAVVDELSNWVRGVETD